MTDPSFNDDPSMPFSTLRAAVRKVAGNGAVVPSLAAAVRVVKSSATVTLFRSTIA